MTVSIENSASKSEARIVGKKPRDRDYVLRRILLAGDLAALCLAFLLAIGLGGTREDVVPDGIWFLLTLPGWALLFRGYALYSRPVRSFEPTHLDDLSRLFHAMVIGTLALWLFYKVIPPLQLSLVEVVLFLALGLMLTATIRRLLRVVTLRRHGAEQVLIITTHDDVQVIRRKLANHPEYQMEVAGAIASQQGSLTLGSSAPVPFEEVERLLSGHSFDHLIVRLDLEFLPAGRAEELMRACFQHGVRFSTYPGPRSLVLPGAQLNHIEGLGILTHDSPVLSRTDRMMKRTLDLVVSSVTLLVTAPLMFAIACAIKFDSKGPVLYRKNRVGQDGARFMFTKFRTMLPDADAMTDEMMKKSLDPNWLHLEDDPRITRVGRFLRRTSLDEMPQLWNVFLGEMSMVGPRPLSERDDLGLLGWERHRLDLVPGITGPWQVMGRTNIPFKEMVEIDFAYVSDWSLWLDLKILIRTVPVVLSRRGSN